MPISAPHRALALIFLAAAMLLLAASPVRADGITDLVNHRMGPPTPAETQEQQIRRLAGEFGVPVRTMAPTSTDNQPDAITLPDLTRTIPTTSEPKKLSASIQILLLLSRLPPRSSS